MSGAASSSVLMWVESRDRDREREIVKALQLQLLELNSVIHFYLPEEARRRNRRMALSFSIVFRIQLTFGSTSIVGHHPPPTNPNLIVEQRRLRLVPFFAFVRERQEKNNNN